MATLAIREIMATTTEIQLQEIRQILHDHQVLQIIMGIQVVLLDQQTIMAHLQTRQQTLIGLRRPIEAILPANTTSTQQALVKEAYRQLGKPYVWGAKGPTTFDCSGLTYYIYKKVTGHSIGGWTGEQQYAGTQIPVENAQPGDLVFWGPASGTTHHVGIYIGNGNYIHAPQPGDHVRITSIKDYRPDFALRVNIAGLPRATNSLASSPILDGINDSFHFAQNQTTDQFVEKIAEDAREIGQEENIYASVMMAQAILESGSGNSLLSRSPN